MSRKTPARFSAYLVTWSDEPSIPVGKILVDKGNRLEADWNVIDFKTEKTTRAVGRRIACLCPDCRVRHGMVGILGHDGDCGSDEVRAEAQGEIKHAARRFEESRA